MNPPPRRSRLLALAIAGLGILLALAAAVVLAPTPKQFLASRIAGDLEAAAPTDLKLRAAQLETLEDDAVPALVDILDSRRENVSGEARRLIDAELDRWQSLPADDASRQVARLAALLSTHVARFGPPGREHARQLALRLIDWPVDPKIVDRTKLVMDCEVLFRASGEVVPARLVRQRPEYRPADEPGVEQPLEPLWRARNGQRAAGPVAAHPDQSLRNQTAAPPPGLSPQARQFGTLRPPVAENRSPTSVPLESRAGETSSPVLDSQPARSPPASPRSPRSSPTGQPSLEFSVTSPPVDQSSASGRQAIGETETLDLMHWLRIERVAAEAAEELARRGFSAFQIQIARRFVDPDPEVRSALARALPQLAGNDPRPWLFWLSRDQDPQVRLAAITILATSLDRAVTDHMRSLAEEETDARVLRLVERVLDQGRRAY